MSLSSRASKTIGATGGELMKSRALTEPWRLAPSGGVVGGACIWIYEASVWVWAQHQMPLIGIPGNATGLGITIM